KGDDEELAKIEIVFDVGSDEYWDRFMRFMQRYAETNGMEFAAAQESVDLTKTIVSCPVIIAMQELSDKCDRVESKNRQWDVDKTARSHLEQNR
ncbi:MAG: hypothetical protein IM556_14900, partial [Pseudanabaena sp. M110S1SP2A07QC]|nr:hypothetical protein [Pseudanabaena sp. M110S1SP2A07QC]